MILNANQVAQNLSNIDFGAKAQHGFDCTVKSIAAMSSTLAAIGEVEGTMVVGGAVLVEKSHPAELEFLTPIPHKLERMGCANKQPLTLHQKVVGWKLPPGVYSVTFNEGGKIPQGLCGWFLPRSSIIRTGNDVRSGLYDAGFECENFGATLHVRRSLFLEINARIAQFVMAKAEVSELYDGQWQGKKDVK